jgi:UDP-GlcNAc3NAcA epimerase
MKILTVLGARPQFIKAATVSRALKAYPSIREIIVHTGQHFDSAMSDVFFDQLDIPKPHHKLGLANLSHGAMTGRMMEAVESVMQTEKPDAVLVYGDTNSTVAGALAAAKLMVPIAHIEAGLRSHNPRMPEEVNRILTDRVSARLYCPTDGALKNLTLEGFPFDVIGRAGAVEKQQAELVGDVMYDAVLFYRERASKVAALSKWKLEHGSYILCTIHRQENTDATNRLVNIASALRRLAEQMTVVLPMHPRTRKKISANTEGANLGAVKIIEPLPYLEMQQLAMGAHMILTDSGGLQKEAYFHGVPCVTLRDETEWVETVSAGWNVLVGAETELIISASNRSVKPDKERPALFGNGDAADRIVRSICDSLS